MNYTQARNTPFSGLAADGAKMALWNLTHIGFRVSAFVHDEFVIELPNNPKTIESDTTLAIQVIKVDSFSMIIIYQYTVTLVYKRNPF